MTTVNPILSSEVKTFIHQYKNKFAFNYINLNITSADKADCTIYRVSCGIDIDESFIDKTKEVYVVDDYLVSVSYQDSTSVNRPIMDEHAVYQVVKHNFPDAYEQYTEYAM